MKGYTNFWVRRISFPCYRKCTVPVTIWAGAKVKKCTVPLTIWAGAKVKKCTVPVTIWAGAKVKK
jgi:hypothetical protein